MIDVRLDRGIRTVSALWVRRIVQKTLNFEKSKTAGVGVLVTDNQRIRRLNKIFLKHDYATDVISFGLGKKDLPGEEKNNLGDLAVSSEMARQMSRKLGLSFRQELARYLVHGTLHLLGYDDRKKRDYQRMHQRQEEILRGMFGEFF